MDGSNNLTEKQTAQLKKARAELCLAQVVFYPLQKEWNEIGEMIEAIEKMLGVS